MTWGSDGGGRVYVDRKPWAAAGDRSALPPPRLTTTPGKLEPAVGRSEVRRDHELVAAQESAGVGLRGDERGLAVC